MSGNICLDYQSLYPSLCNDKYKSQFKNFNPFPDSFLSLFPNLNQNNDTNINIEPNYDIESSYEENDLIIEI